MVLRVVEQGWTLTEAAAAAEVSERRARSGSRATGPRASAGLLDRSLGARRVANRTARATVEAIAALRRLRFTGPEIAELLGMAAVDGLGDPDADRDGQARPARAGARRRYERAAAGRADPHRRQEARPDRRRRRQAHPRRRPPLHRLLHRRRRRVRRKVGWDYVHIAIDDATRLAYAEVLPDEKATTAIGFLRRAVAFYARHGITVERVITDNGSCLPLDHPRDRLPHPGHPPPAHPALPPADQRQSRALHPHHARRLGLRRDLRLKPRTHRSP